MSIRNDQDVDVFVERSGSAAEVRRDSGRLFATYATCNRLYGLQLLGAFASSDGRRMLCRFRAPDAECVRMFVRRAGIATDRVWTGTELIGARPADTTR